MSWTVDIHEDAWFALHLGAEHEGLPEGDFKFEHGDKTFLIERKTWGDAYNSWRSNRLEDQLSRMLEKTPHSIVLIEGRKESIYQSSPHVNGGPSQRDQIKNLQAVLNRLSAEICPVVYTDGKEDTRRYLQALATRVESGSFGKLVRKPTMVKSSRNKHHVLLQSIPGIGRSTAKKIYSHYPSLKAMINEWDNALEAKLVGPKRFEDTKAFLEAEWISEPSSSKDSE